MRDKLNCPNCGAPITSIECPYCSSVMTDVPEIVNTLESGIDQTHYVYALCECIPAPFPLEFLYQREHAADLLGLDVLNAKKSWAFGIEEVIKMTDTEMQRRKAICDAAGVSEIDDVSDGFHTFRQLYYQRMLLFAELVKIFKDKAWKSLRHEDGELCFGGGWFVVGIDTPDGSYTYHYEDKYFDLFDCKILDCAKHWDGHTEKDVTRLLSLTPVRPKQLDKKGYKINQRSYPAKWLCSECGAKHFDFGAKFCSNCGTNVEEGEPEWLT